MTIFEIIKNKSAVEKLELFADMLESKISEYFKTIITPIFDTIDTGTDRYVEWVEWNDLDSLFWAYEEMCSDDYELEIEPRERNVASAVNLLNLHIECFNKIPDFNKIYKFREMLACLVIHDKLIFRKDFIKQLADQRNIDRQKKLIISLNDLISRNF